MDNKEISEKLKEVVRRQKFLLRQTGAMIHARHDIQNEWNAEFDRLEAESKLLISKVGISAIHP